MRIKTFPGRIVTLFAFGLCAGPFAQAESVTFDAEAVARPVPELTESQRQRAHAITERNIARLRRQGKLPEVPAGTVHPQFAWPLRSANGLTDFGYHAVSNFVDHDFDYPGHLEDFLCGGRTYDTDFGYNHRGTDYFTWPFSWYRMEDDQVEVIAAAAGIIVLREDGHFDRSCGPSSDGWNAVFVMHDDGSIARYGHLKNGSVTSKTVGESVEVGEYLGVAGSSGSSSEPHLHFEVYDSGGQLIDPYEGPCNTLNTDSWWIEQRPYFDSAVNKVATGFAPPVFPDCPEIESPNERNVFNLGDTIYFTAYYRERLSTQLSDHLIWRPDGSLAWFWSHTVSYYRPDWHSERRFDNFAAGGPAGTWTYEVGLGGELYSHEFHVGVAVASGAVPTGRPDAPGKPLLLSKEDGGAIRLDWHPSCLGTDTDYEIYEGQLDLLRQRYSHTSKFCSTSGHTAKSFVPAADANLYYIVVPSNTVREGSHGVNSDGDERPRALGNCLPQLIDTCSYDLSAPRVSPTAPAP